jgi:hypothetical protein
LRQHLASPNNISLYDLLVLKIEIALAPNVEVGILIANTKEDLQA